jgi:hypothetical protein
LKHALAVLHPTNPVEVLGLVELGAGLVEPLADALGDVLGAVVDHHRDEVVTAHVPTALTPSPRRRVLMMRAVAYQLVASDEPFWSL